MAETYSNGSDHLHLKKFFSLTVNFTDNRFKSQAFTCIVANSVAQEPEGSSPPAQQPANGPCPETVESNPQFALSIK
jgi:hypothetical protein